MPQWLLLTVAIAVGMLLPVQGGINATLGRSLGSALYGAIASFLIGTAGLIAFCLALRTQSPLPTLQQPGELPLWAWTGGLLGAVYVTATILLVPRLGYATTTGAFIVGQVMIALLLDQFGLLGFPQQSISWGRLAGAVLLLCGLLLIRKF